MVTTNVCRYITPLLSGFALKAWPRAQDLIDLIVERPDFGPHIIIIYLFELIGICCQVPVAPQPSEPGFIDVGM